MDAIKLAADYLEWRSDRRKTVADKHPIPAPPCDQCQLQRNCPQECDAFKQYVSNQSGKFNTKLIPQ